MQRLESVLKHTLENERKAGGSEKVSISMIGIDHNKASLDVRALFSFTKKAAGDAMLAIKELEGV